MSRTIEAVFEDGVLKPLAALDLPEHQRVRLTIDAGPADPPDQGLQAWWDVYRGLADDEVTAIEAIALDRRRFMGPAR